MAGEPVLDTDVLIDYLRGAGPGRDLLRRLTPALSFRTTAVSAFELALGASYERDRDAIDAIFTRCLALERPAAALAGLIQRRLRAAGAPIDVRDALQAGICLASGTPLVTRNVSHFARVEGLVVVAPDRWR